MKESNKYALITYALIIAANVGLFVEGISVKGYVFINTMILLALVMYVESWRTFYAKPKSNGSENELLR